MFNQWRCTARRREAVPEIGSGSVMQLQSRLHQCHWHAHSVICSHCDAGSQYSERGLQICAPITFKHAQLQERQKSYGAAMSCLHSHINGYLHGHQLVIPCPPHPASMPLRQAIAFHRCTCDFPRHFAIVYSVSAQVLLFTACCQFTSYSRPLLQRGGTRHSTHSITDQSSGFDPIKASQAHIFAGQAATQKKAEDIASHS